MSYDLSDFQTVRRQGDLIFQFMLSLSCGIYVVIPIWMLFNGVFSATNHKKQWGI